MTINLDEIHSRYPYDWAPAHQGDRPWDQLDFDVDIGCGRVPKGKLGIDHRLPDPRDFPGVEMDLDQPRYLCLPFEDESVGSIITHHCLEHIGEGLPRLMEECYRVLRWGGVMRIIVPLFPSTTAVEEYDHKRYFMKNTWQGFCNHPNGQSYTDGFAEPYNLCGFKLIDQDMSPPTPPEKMFTDDDHREQRVTLWKWTGSEPGNPRPIPGASIPDPKDYIR